jgi:arsenite methyltransferase
MNTAAELSEGVRAAYSAAAERPAEKHAFPIGREFAASLGYSDRWLAQVPAPAVDAFAGVCNVAEFAEFEPGMKVLDLGCGSGLDALIAAHRVGPTGEVFGVDYSEAMLDRARHAARLADLGNVEFVLASADRLPFPGGSFDVALVNGIFNLNPSREALFRELARVVRLRGAVYAAELILVAPLAEGSSCNATNWFA